MAAQAASRHLVHDLFGCPHCGHEAFEAVSDGERTDFVCLACGACWHLELGYITPVALEHGARETATVT